MISSPENLTGAGKSLASEPVNAAALDGLMRSAHARLHDAHRTDLSLESRFGLAYNAAHALCLAALRRLGYRAHHPYIVFQVLPQTLGLGPEVWRVPAKCHEVRNLGEYEGTLEIDEDIVTSLVEATVAVSKRLEHSMADEA